MEAKCHEAQRMEVGGKGCILFLAVGLALNIFRIIISLHWLFKMAFLRFICNHTPTLTPSFFLPSQGHSLLLKMHNAQNSLLPTPVVHISQNRQGNKWPSSLELYNCIHWFSLCPACVLQVSCPLLLTHQRPGLTE